MPQARSTCLIKKFEFVVQCPGEEGPGSIPRVRDGVHRETGGLSLAYGDGSVCSGVVFIFGVGPGTPGLDILIRRHRFEPIRSRGTKFPRVCQVYGSSFCDCIVILAVDRPPSALAALPSKSGFGSGPSSSSLKVSSLPSSESANCPRSPSGSECPKRYAAPRNRICLESLLEGREGPDAGAGSNSSRSNSKSDSLSSSEGSWVFSG